MCDGVNFIVGCINCALDKEMLWLNEAKIHCLDSLNHNFQVALTSLTAHWWM